MERIGRPIDLLEQALAEAAAPASPDVVEALRGLLAWADRVHDEEDTSRLLDHLERHDALDRAREVLAALPATPAGLDEGRVRALFREMWHESMHPGDGIDESCVVCIRKADDLIEYCRAYAEGEPTE
jgi:hypothetical protein